MYKNLLYKSYTVFLAGEHVIAHASLFARTQFKVA